MNNITYVKRKVLKFYFTVFFVCFSFLGFCQNQFKADSLKNHFNSGDLSNSFKLKVLKDIAHNETNPEVALKYAEQLLKLSRRLNDSVFLFSAHLQIGYAYRLQGNLDLAIESFISCLKIAQFYNFTDKLGTAYLTLGDVYSSSGHFENSINYYHLAIQSLRNVDKPIVLGSALSNLGYEYYIHNKLDSAYFYFDQSNTYWEEANYKHGIAYNIGNIGLVYAKKGDNKSAEIAIDSAITMLREFNDQYAIADFQNEMAGVYIEVEQYDKALIFLQESYKSAISLDLKEQIRDASLKLAELYEVAKEYENAFKYQSQYIAYRDSINNEETIRKMADLRTEYEVSQKQIEVDLLQEKQKGFFFAVFFLIILLILIGTLAYVFLIRNKEKHQANLLLTRQTKELEALNATKDRFFSIISHDLRAPVSAFKGLSSLMKFSVDQKKYDDLPEITDRITNSSNRLSLLLDNLLEWAVNQQGQLLYTPEKIDVKELIHGIVPIFQNMAISKEISLEIELEEEVIAWADKNSMMTILRNLINNALKFTENGGNVTVSATSATDFVSLSVKDTGVGMPTEKLAILFQLKEKKSTWGTEGEKGLGLGLRLAYEFSEMNKGSIAVESEENVGSTFTVKLPIYKG